MNNFFEESISEQTKVNLEHIEKNINDKEYKKKIKNWSKKFSFNYSIIFDKAKKDCYFRAFFAKDPLKQNIIEKKVANKIKNISGIYKFSKLPNHGKNSLYLNQGEITNKYQLDKPTKSIDFYWKIKNKNMLTIDCFAYHKYINEPGGAQDNQFIDIKNTIKNAPKQKRKYLFLICDGNYFTKKKQKELKEINKNKNCIITSTGRLENEVKEIKSFDL